MRQYRGYSRQLLTQSEAETVLRFIFGGTLAHPATDLERRFAQFLLAELLDKSIAMGFVESIFRASMRPSASVTSICRKMLTSSVPLAYNWFNLSTTHDLVEAADDIKIYRTVLIQLKRNFRSEWEMMQAGI